MDEPYYSEVVGGYTLTVVKWADRFDNVFAFVWASVGLGIMALSDGWLGWGPDVTEARWLVQVRDQRDPDDIRTVRTTFTRRGAKRAARQVRAVLATGDEQAIKALPDFVYA